MFQLAHQLRHNRCRCGTRERQNQFIPEVPDQFEKVLADQIADPPKHHQCEDDQGQINHANQFEQGQQRGKSKGRNGGTDHAEYTYRCVGHDDGDNLEHRIRNALNHSDHWHALLSGK
ncbi:hypothetical protein D9M71_816370 [compost metagenome]